MNELNIFFMVGGGCMLFIISFIYNTYYPAMCISKDSTRDLNSIKYQLIRTDIVLLLTTIAFIGHPLLSNSLDEQLYKIIFLLTVLTAVLFIGMAFVWGYRGLFTDKGGGVSL